MNSARGCPVTSTPLFPSEHVCVCVCGYDLIKTLNQPLAGWTYARLASICEQIASKISGFMELDIARSMRIPDDQLLYTLCACACVSRHTRSVRFLVETLRATEKLIAQQTLASVIYSRTDKLSTHTRAWPSWRCLSPVSTSSRRRPKMKSIYHADYTQTHTHTQTYTHMCACVRGYFASPLCLRMTLHFANI